MLFESEEYYKINKILNQSDLKKFRNLKEDLIRKNIKLDNSILKEYLNLRDKVFCSPYGDLISADYKNLIIDYELDCIDNELEIIYDYPFLDFRRKSIECFIYDLTNNLDNDALIKNFCNIYGKNFYINIVYLINIYNNGLHNFYNIGEDYFINKSLEKNETIFIDFNVYFCYDYNDIIILSSIVKNNKFCFIKNINVINENTDFLYFRENINFAKNNYLKINMNNFNFVNEVNILGDEFVLFSFIKNNKYLIINKNAYDLHFDLSQLHCNLLIYNDKTLHNLDMFEMYNILKNLNKCKVSEKYIKLVELLDLNIKVFFGYRLFSNDSLKYVD